MSFQELTLRYRLSLLTAFLATSGAVTANTILFEENFSAGLNAWTGKDGGPHKGIVVADPFNPANSVLSFSGLSVSGDIFTRDSLTVGPSGHVIVSFDYLGGPSSGSTPGNLGGFLGISVDLLPEGGDAAWIAGTELSAVNGLGFTGIELIDDGQWHRYDLDITSLLLENNISSIHLMLEDWTDAGGIAGDAYFDNIQVTSIGVPEGGSTLGYALISAALFAFVTRRKSKSLSETAK